MTKDLNRNNEYVEFSPENMVEVELYDPDDFLKVKETLTRMGIASRKDENKLYQSCMILHKQKRYYIVHFKELYGLDGRPTTITTTDLKRRNTIAKLLCEWGLVDLVTDVQDEDCVPVRQIKIIPYREKDEWELISKYPIGKYKKH